MNAPAEATVTAIVPSKPRLELLRPVAPAEEIIAARSEIVNLLPRVLKEGVDFVTIPGTDKPTLSKAGAERVGAIFGTHPEYEIVEKEIDHDRVIEYESGWVESDDKPASKQEANRLKAAGKGRWKKKGENDYVWMVRASEGAIAKSIGLYRFVIRCRIVRQDGLVIGDGLASCSTLESKYISRPRDCENTVLKMAEKRAFVGATLNAFSLSDRFGADVEERAEPSRDRGDVVDAEVVEERTAEAVRGSSVESRKARAKAWALGYLTRLDACTDKEQALDLMKAEHEKRDRLRDVDATLAAGVDAYDAMTMGGRESLSDEETVALKWLETERATAKAAAEQAHA